MYLLLDISLFHNTRNHPNMPWDSTELRVTDIYDAKSNVSSDHKLIAGEDGDTSIIQPTYDQRGRLYYISDQSGYYNIYRAGFEESILPMDADFGGAAPGWQLGQQGFTSCRGKMVDLWHNSIKMARQYCSLQM